MPVAAVTGAPNLGRNVLALVPYAQYTRVWVARQPPNLVEPRRLAFIEFGIRFSGGDYYQLDGKSLWYSGVLFTAFAIPPFEGDGQIEVAAWVRETNLQFYWELAGEP